MREFTAFMFGQSNAHGPDTLAGGWFDIHPAVRIRSIENNVWFHPVVGAWPIDRTGPEGDPIVPLYIKIANALARLHGYDRVNVIAVTRGGHSIEAWMTPALRAARGWPLPAGMTDLSQLVYPGVRNALDDLGLEYADAVMVHQGETHGSDDAATYRAKFWQVIVAMKNDGILDPQRVPLVVGSLSERLAWQTEHKAAFFDKQAGIQGWCGGLKWVSSHAVAQPGDDDVHFNGRGTDQLARRYVEALFNPAEW